MHTLIFAPETINIAETTRMIEIAKRCQHKYQCIFIGYTDTFSYLIKEEGFSFKKMRPWLTEAEIEHLWQVDRMEKWADPFSREQLEMRVQSELDIYKAYKPLAVVIGFTLSVVLSAKIAKIPLVYVLPFSYSPPFFQAEIADVPEQFDTWAARLFPVKFRKKLIRYWGLNTSIWVKPFRQVAKQYGLDAFKKTMELVQGDHNLLATAPELTGVHALPPSWHYVGPIYAKLSGEIPQEILSLPQNKPLIYFAMGSSANRDVLIKVLQSFKELPYQIISPMKFHLQQVNIEIPENVLLFDWLPAHLVNPLADLSIIHGGEGTVQTACMSGKPFIGIGLQPEQEANIDYCVQFGNAKRLKRKDISPTKLHNLIESSLSDAQLKGKAIQIKKILEKYDGPQQVADYISNTFT